MMVYHSMFTEPLKAGSCHDANLVITDDTGGCHNNNRPEVQWRQSWHYNNSRISVGGIIACLHDNDNDNDNESMFIVKVVQNQNQIINKASTWYIT